jgi:hypothetical protein
MALHRDIFWIGRQWAVTGFGVQAIDQRLKGAFDIEALQVWDQELHARMRDQPWINADDFDKALTMARKRFPEPANKSKALMLSVLEPHAAVAEQQPAPSREDSAHPQPAETAAPVGRSRTAPPQLQLRLQGRLARFVPQWRVRR